MMRILAASLGAKHRFSTAYVPWSNRTADSVCKQVLRVMRALSVELRMPESDWPKTVSAIQSVINNYLSLRLDNRSPIEVHTGMSLNNPLSMALSSFETRDVDFTDQTSILQKLRIEEILQALDEMHKSVNDSLTTSRTQAVDCHNAKTHTRPFNPTVGNYVVVARSRRPRTKNSRPGEYIYLNPTDGAKTSNKQEYSVVGPYRNLLNHRRTITIDRDGVMERVSANRCVYAPLPTNGPRASTTTRLTSPTRSPRVHLVFL